MRCIQKAEEQYLVTILPLTPAFKTKLDLSFPAHPVKGLYPNEVAYFNTLLGLWCKSLGPLYIVLNERLSHKLTLEF